jgi:hypothetical protein
VTRALLSAPLIRAARSPTTSPLDHDVTHPLAQKAIDHAIATIREATPAEMKRSLTFDAAKSPATLRSALSAFRSASSPPEDPSALGDAGFQLLRYMGETDALSFGLLAPSTEANGTNAAQRMDRSRATDLRAGDCLLADPMA